MQGYIKFGIIPLLASIMLSSDEATIISLRRDLALQIARALRQRGLTQVRAANQLNVPQPTLSKIINGRTNNLSIEILLRIGVRMGLCFTLHTGDVPEEAGAFVSKRHRFPYAGRKSRIADEARHSLESAHRRLAPSQRLEAFLEHNQLLAELRQAGREAYRLRAGKARSTP